MDETQIVGCILGTAVGDALGLPYEGVSRSRSPRLLGPPDRHRFFFRRGMISDDTEHTCLVTQSLIVSQNSSDEFSRELARRFRWWFLSLPAGMGRATIRACVKLWLGVSPKSSGVFSAGNGPAMRAAIFGAAFDDLNSMLEFVKVSSRMTHSDPKAEYGAIAIALATMTGRTESEVDSGAYVDKLAGVLGNDGKELILLLRNVCKSVLSGESTLDFAAANGNARGVSGYTYHTVPVAIHAWLSHPRDYRSAVTVAIECGGDADTTAAIVGGIVGASVGESGIPAEWLSKLCEWPRTVGWMRRLGEQLAHSASNETGARPTSLNFGFVLMRNMIFLAIVLFHGFRRLLPPY